MNILYCGDSNIVDGLIISILSLIKHESGDLNIYVFSMDYEDKKSVSEKTIKKLDELVKKTNKNSFVKLIDVKKYFLEEIPLRNIDTLFTPYCMLRLYADLVPNMPSKIMYLDNDVIAYNSFKSFYDLDNSKYEIVGARDFYGKYFYSKNKIKKDYLNSGVLIMNLDLIKKSGSFKKARSMCQTRKMLLPDQAAINKYCKPKLIVKRKYWKNILILFLIPVAMFYIIKGPVWKAFNIIPMGSEEALSVPLQQFARIIKYEKDNLTEEEYNEIHKYLNMTDEEIIEEVTSYNKSKHFNGLDELTRTNLIQSTLKTLKR